MDLEGRTPTEARAASGTGRRRARWRIVAGVAAIAFASVLVALDLWGWELQGAYGRLIGYDGCMCEQCRDYYLGSF